MERRVYRYETVGSTNTELTELIRQGAAEGTVVLARQQTAGRGRMGRSFQSPAGLGLYGSVLLRSSPEDAPRIPALAATAVRRAIRRSCGLSCGIKWPNDLVLSGRKVCGILAEALPGPEGSLWVVVGIGFRNDSFASMSPYVQWVVTIFMILFGVNFNAYFLLLMRRFRRAAASEEVRAYFVIIGVAVVIITANIYSMYNGLDEALRHAAFQVGSIITTTGFSSCDFDLWPTLSKEILVMLMFVGACAGSTGGGIKVSRLLLMGKTVGKELKQALHPQVVAPVRMDGKVVNHETIRATNVFVAAYIFIFAASFFLISLDGFDMVTNFTAIAATLNNIGPGLAQVGPMMNFGSYSNPAKLVMIFDMLAGRLEIFPMLVFFMPDTWRRF